MSDLSEELKYWRCERPSEYKMDDFIRSAQLMEKKLKGLEDIDEVSAGYRDIAEYIIKELEDEGCYPTTVQEFRKKFNEVGK